MQGAIVPTVFHSLHTSASSWVSPISRQQTMWHGGEVMQSAGPLHSSVAPVRLKWPLIESSSTLAEGLRCRSLCSLPLGNMKWGETLRTPPSCHYVWPYSPWRLNFPSPGESGGSPVHRKKNQVLVIYGQTKRNSEQWSRTEALCNWIKIALTEPLRMTAPQSISNYRGL